MARYFITDIHGELSKLKALIERLDLNEGDRLIFGGDYVDRGPDSCGVIEYIIALSEKYDVVTLAGNHDREFLRAIVEVMSSDVEWDWGGSYFSFWSHGLDKTVESYQRSGIDPSKHEVWLARLKPYHIEDLMLFVHAGFNRFRYVRDQSEAVFLWDRDFINLAYSYECSLTPAFNPEQRSFTTKDDFRKVFLGHHPTFYLKEGERLPIYMEKARVWACDTGCGKEKDAILCAVNIDTNQVITHKEL